MTTTSPSATLPSLLSSHAATTTSNLSALSTATSHLQSLLDSPLPLSQNTLALAGRIASAHYTTFLDTQDSSHLLASIALLNATCSHSAVPDIPPSLAAGLATDHCAYMTVRYAMTKTDADYEDVTVLLRGALVGMEARGGEEGKRPLKWNLWKCLEVRWAGGGGLERGELEEAIGLGKGILEERGPVEEGVEEMDMDMDEDRVEVARVMGEMWGEWQQKGFDGERETGRDQAAALPADATMA